MKQWTKEDFPVGTMISIDYRDNLETTRIRPFLFIITGLRADNEDEIEMYDIEENQYATESISFINNREGTYGPCLKIVHIPELNNDKT